MGRSIVQNSRTSRRHFLATSAALTVSPFLKSCAMGTREESRLVVARLVPEQATAQVLAGERAATGVWAYNGSVPGPVLRARQGDRLRVEVENRLDEATTVHWHGIRVPNAMDGVPLITQPPIEPGERFVYEFALL
ncbi:MAG TPA: multicopper oxidase domain-containing protein, partial [Burkholderiales bacterium]|nr:multicopper oxidase domain-containing protein [Burkholderiales bacterium]